jgi:hypothetical protein
MSAVVRDEDERSVDDREKKRRKTAAAREANLRAKDEHAAAVHDRFVRADARPVVDLSSLGSKHWLARSTNITWRMSRRRKYSTELNQSSTQPLTDASFVAMPAFPMFSK